MSRQRAPQPLAPPLLDRLLDDEPRAQVEEPPTRDRVGRVLLEAVRRDLEVLLNTRQRLLTPPPGPSELERSLVEYGLPATRGAELTSPQRREDLRLAVEAAIRRFEPRLKDVRVALVVDSGPAESLQLVVHATLVVDRAPETVAFRTALDARSGRLAVEGVGP